MILTQIGKADRNKMGKRKIITTLESKNIRFMALFIVYFAGDVCEYEDEKYN